MWLSVHVRAREIVRLAHNRGTNLCLSAPPATRILLDTISRSILCAYACVHAAHHRGIYPCLQRACTSFHSHPFRLKILTLLSKTGSLRLPQCTQTIPSLRYFCQEIDKSIRAINQNSAGLPKGEGEERRRNRKDRGAMCVRGGGLQGDTLVSLTSRVRYSTIPKCPS